VAAMGDTAAPVQDHLGAGGRRGKLGRVFTSINIFHSDFEFATCGCVEVEDKIGPKNDEKFEYMSELKLKPTGTKLGRQGLKSLCVV
jgi:hypothetical protein